MVLAVGFSLPETHIAVAEVAPDRPGYEEPIGLYLSEVNSPVLLQNLAGPQPSGIASLWVGPPDERLRAPDWDTLTRDRKDSTLNLEIEVRVRGLTTDEAKRVADGVAAEIVRLDAEAAAANATAPVPSQAASSGPSVASIQAALARLRAQNPALVSEDGTKARLSSEEQTWERRRESERGLETRYTQEVAHSEDLRLRVLEEARALWEAYKAEQIRKAKAAADAARKRDPIRLEEPTGTLAELEAELRRLLATRTLRHPEVRHLLRRIELERARLASLQQEIPADAPGALPAEEVLPGALPPEGARLPEGEGSVPIQPGTQPLGEGGSVEPPDERITPPPPSPEDSLPADPLPAEPLPEDTSGEVGLELEIADDERAEDSVAESHEIEVPAEWIQKAPSYREWTSARDRASRTSARFEAEQAQTEAMRARLDRERRDLEAREQSLQGIRGTEARLEDELARARQMRPMPFPVRSGPRPRLRASSANSISSFRPVEHIFQGLAVAVLFSLLFAWWIDRRDPAIHEGQDLSDLRVPVLGVIPHLR